MPNLLAREKSPYLLQHANNPVDWHPWDDAALARARAEQKPIFLSIGYSTCHWCHVMEHESFENLEIAALLNADFISIKVDREERPDVDHVYMHYVQSMSGRGGWPLNVWLTPELKPFFGGTYFPPDDRHSGRTSFPAVLRAIAAGWKNERDKLIAEGERVIATLRQHAEDQRTSHASTASASGDDLTEPAGAAFERGIEHYYESYDQANGGFGGAPKFPRAGNLSFLTRAAALQGKTSEVGTTCLTMIEGTLRKMAMGGIRDHVGGGFHRYSVDDKWFVPHFEKMLYDQAQIASNYLDAFQATGRESYAWVVRDIFTYVQRDLSAPDGSFYSAEDADSLTAPGGHMSEGAFYIWSKSELDTLLTPESSALLCAHYGVLAHGNVPADQDPHHYFTAKNILHQQRPLAETARLLGLDIETANTSLVAAHEKLRAHRATRPRPLLDDKVIAAWNGLMISSFARAGSILSEPQWITAARRATIAVRTQLYDETSGILYRNARNGERSANEGFAEDYACLIQGLLDLYEADFDAEWLRWALRLQTRMDTLFWDHNHGGYFNSRADDPAIVLRLKEDYDGAEPAPSSVAALNLLRLAPLGGETFSTRAKQTLCAFRHVWERMPHGLPVMMSALETALEPPRQVILSGDPSSPEFQALTAVLHEQIGPRRTLWAAIPNKHGNWLSEQMPMLSAMKPTGDPASAYVCEDHVCRPPVGTPAGLRAVLEI